MIIPKIMDAEQTSNEGDIACNDGNGVSTYTPISPPLGSGWAKYLTRLLV